MNWMLGHLLIISLLFPLRSANDHLYADAGNDAKGQQATCELKVIE